MDLSAPRTHAHFGLRELAYRRNRRREASKLTGEEIYMAFLNFALLRFRYGFRPRPRPPAEELAHSGPKG